MSGPHRISALDGLRGFAAMAVVLCHFADSVKEAYGQDFTFAFSAGRYGVQLFFMISGFVILLTLSRTPSVVDFAVSRFARLYPAYWAAIAVAYVLITSSHLYPDRDVGRLYPLINMTMLQEAFGVIHYLLVFWTLYVELQFYFLVAAVTLLGLQRCIDEVLCVAISVTILGSLGYVPGWETATTAIPLLKHLHAFALGICMFRLLDGVSYRTVLCAVLSLVNAWTLSGPGYALLVLALAAVAAAAVYGKLSFVGWPVFAGIGTISYSLYLLHQPIGRIFLRWSALQGAPLGAALLGAIVVAFAAATALTFLVERPANRLLVSNWKAFRSRRLLVATPVYSAESSAGAVPLS